jgi:hypothetical protein
LLGVTIIDFCSIQRKKWIFQLLDSDKKIDKVEFRKPSEGYSSQKRPADYQDMVMWLHQPREGGVQADAECMLESHKVNSEVETKPFTSAFNNGPKHAIEKGEGGQVLVYCTLNIWWPMPLFLIFI